MSCIWNGTWRWWCSVNLEGNCREELVDCFVHLSLWWERWRCPCVRHDAICRSGVLHLLLLLALQSLVDLNLVSGGIAALIINLCTRWRWVVSFTPRPFYPVFALNMRVDGLSNQSGYFAGSGRGKISFPWLDVNHNSLVLQPVAYSTIWTELSWL
jgi:hypothetical protein